MSINIALIIVACFTVFVGALGFVYTIWVQPLVRLYFGENDFGRRDYDAVRRRKQFERRVGRAIQCLLVCCVVGVAQGILEVRGIQSLGALTAIRIGSIAIAALFGLAAYYRWKNPYED